MVITLDGHEVSYSCDQSIIQSLLWLIVKLWVIFGKKKRSFQQKHCKSWSFEYRMLQLAINVGALPNAQNMVI